MSNAQDQPDNVAKKGDPIKFGITLIATGILVDVVVLFAFLAYRQPWVWIVALFSLYNFYTGVKNIRQGLRDRATEHDPGTPAR